MVCAHLLALDEASEAVGGGPRGTIQALWMARNIGVFARWARLTRGHPVLVIVHACFAVLTEAPGVKGPKHARWAGGIADGVPSRGAGAHGEDPGWTYSTAHFAVAWTHNPCGAGQRAIGRARQGPSVWGAKQPRGGGGALVAWLAYAAVEGGIGQGVCPQGRARYCKAHAWAVEASRTWDGACRGSRQGEIACWTHCHCPPHAVGA
jgi:hypothetical protein